MESIRTRPLLSTAQMMKRTAIKASFWVLVLLWVAVLIPCAHAVPGEDPSTQAGRPTGAGTSSKRLNPSQLAPTSRFELPPAKRTKATDSDDRRRRNARGARMRRAAEEERDSAAEDAGPPASNDTSSAGEQHDPGPDDPGTEDSGDFARNDKSSEGAPSDGLPGSSLTTDLIDEEPLSKGVACASGVKPGVACLVSEAARRRVL